jgi:hypothetical protein
VLITRDFVTSMVVAGVAAAAGNPFQGGTAGGCFSGVCGGWDGQRGRGHFSPPWLIRSRFFPGRCPVPSSAGKDRAAAIR